MEKEANLSFNLKILAVGLSITSVALVVIAALFFLGIVKTSFNDSAVSTQEQIRAARELRCQEYENSEDYRKTFSVGYDAVDAFYSTKLDTCINSYWVYETIPDGTRAVTRHVIVDVFAGSIIFYETNAPLWTATLDSLRE